jgi:peptide/nickel transport system permease protein
VSTAPAPVALEPEAPSVAVRSYRRLALRRLSRQPVTLVALAVLFALAALGELAPVLAPKGWNSIDLEERWRNHGPTLASGHLLGTDNIGRDVLDRTLWALHYSVQTAFLAGLGATALALLLGVFAGYRGGWLDAFLMRIADLVTGFPVIVVMIAVFVWLRPITASTATLVFALAMWPFAARVIRARATTLAAAEFVQAARALGASDLRIIARHILPNAAGAVAVAASALVGQIVLVESLAEFFGYGIPSITRPTLGNLIAEATQGGLFDTLGTGLGWWTWATPVIALILLLAAVNLIGDGLDTALNPRSRRH